jgi:hypothetical protein
MTDQPEHNGGHDGHGEHGTMGVHGMLLFGDEALYLSHLPMFERPHNFQVILEVAFDDAVAEALRTDRDADGHGMHTFKPVVFHITELDPSGEGPARSSIEGTIYHGHFERGGQPIARGAVAEVHNVVYFNELDLEADHEMGEELRYLCFGRAGQLHLAHQITASPDFDQVLTARLVAGTVTDPSGRPVAEEVTRGFDTAAQVLFRERRDTPEDRLAPNETAGGFFFATVGPTGSHGFGVQVEIGRELYVEMRELGSR